MKTANVAKELLIVLKASNAVVNLRVLVETSLQAPKGYSSGRTEEVTAGSQ